MIGDPARLAPRRRALILLEREEGVGGGDRLAVLPADPGAQPELRDEAAARRARVVLDARAPVLECRDRHREPRDEIAMRVAAHELLGDRRREDPGEGLVGEDRAGLADDADDHVTARRRRRRAAGEGERDEEHGAEDRAGRRGS